jgi:hypothetical protein
MPSNGRASIRAAWAAAEAAVLTSHPCSINSGPVPGGTVVVVVDGTVVVVAGTVVVVGGTVVVAATVVVGRIVVVVAAAVVVAATVVVGRIVVVVASVVVARAVVVVARAVVVVVRCRANGRTAAAVADPEPPVCSAEMSAVAANTTSTTLLGLGMVPLSKIP